MDKNIDKQQEIIDFYDNIYKRTGKSSMRPYTAYPIFLEYLDIKKSKKLLDIACGTGCFLLASHRIGLKTYGIDVSSEAVEIAKKVSPDSIIKLSNAEKLPFKDNFFDYITCLGSLEHFINIEKSLKEIKRVSKNSTQLCIMIPNKNYILGNNKNKNNITKTLLSLKGWVNLFENNGFSIKKILQDEWFMRKRDLESPLPLEVTYQFVFIMQNKKQVKKQK